jgi:hypothetical protein
LEDDVGVRAEAPVAPPANRWLRIVDEQTGVVDVVGRVESVERMAETVARCLEAGRAGTRFPLLRLVPRRPALTGEECDALSREVPRLRAVLACVGVENLRPAGPGAGSDPALSAAAPLEPAPEPFPRWNGSGAPRTLADAFAWPLHVLEHGARLGAASRRGARLEAVVDGAWDGARSRLHPAADPRHRVPG